MLPSHRTSVAPFTDSAAVPFAKAIPTVVVVNDAEPEIAEIDIRVDAASRVPTRRTAYGWC